MCDDLWQTQKHNSPEIKIHARFDILDLYRLSPLFVKKNPRYLLLAGVLVSFLDPDPDGEGRVPLAFFGRMVPLFTVGRNGRVAIIGLAGRKRTIKSVFRKQLDVRINCCGVIQVKCE